LTFVLYYRSDGTTYEFSAAYLGRLGYMASLKCCISGLLLVSDVSVSCFLKGGRLIDLMAAIGGFRTIEDLYRETSSSQRQGLPSQIIHAIDDTLRSCRLKVLHLGHSKKLKGFGPAANHPDSAFTLDTGESITVATYFQQMAQSNLMYQKYLPRGELAYPRLPCIEVGSKKKAIRIPPELLEVIPGQSRSKTLPGDIAGNIIRYAAMLPNDRFTKLSIESKDSGIFEALENDVNAQGFGLNHIQTKPMKVQGVILPPPKLQYGNRVIEPGLKGAWNLAGNVTFAYPAPSDRSSGSKQYSYGLVVAYARSAPGNILQMTEEFQRQLEKASSIVGIPMRMCSDAPYMVEGKRDIVENAFANIRSKGARIIIVLLKDDVYPVIKLAGDGLGIPTQCVKWKNVEKPPSNYHTSVLIKVNGKLGGVNHTLASRSSNPSAEAAMDTFQTPPKSISWLFDAPCMILVSSLYLHTPNSVLIQL
jgi:eukaryotic translation initiation factor 2C